MRDVSSPGCYQWPSRWAVRPHTQQEGPQLFVGRYDGASPPAGILHAPQRVRRLGGPCVPQSSDQTPQGALYCSTRGPSSWGLLQSPRVKTREGPGKGKGKPFLPQISDADLCGPPAPSCHFSHKSTVWGRTARSTVHRTPSPSSSSKTHRLWAAKRLVHVLSRPPTLDSSTASRQTVGPPAPSAPSPVTGSFHLCDQGPGKSNPGENVGRLCAAPGNPRGRGTCSDR